MKSISLEQRPLKTKILGVLGFFEPSTRTKLSFEAAGRHLGIDWLDLKPQDLSLQKGESFQDTFKNIAQYGVKFFVIRHSASYFPHLVHEWTGLPVLNAGDGMNEHPTQALGDAMTLFQTFKGKAKICFIGDAFRSRVARSSLRLFQVMGHSVSLVDDGRDKKISEENKAFAHAFGIPVIPRSKISSCDLVYCLRSQKERGSVGSQNPLNSGDLGKTTKLMHAAPVIWGEDMLVEIQNLSPDRNLILLQAENCFRVRTRLLKQIGEAKTR